MGLSILEVLMNAEHNLQNRSLPFQQAIGMEQLQNAIKALEADPDSSKEWVDKEPEDD